VGVMVEGGRPECQAMSARQRRQPCQVFSSTEEKSKSVSVLIRPSSIFWNRIEMISLEYDCGRDRTIRETALAAVYRTIVSFYKTRATEIYFIG
jgi:hypothetical protein